MYGSGAGIHVFTFTSIEIGEREIRKIVCILVFPMQAQTMN
jgi:hypothetical protein